MRLAVVVVVAGALLMAGGAAISLGAAPALCTTPEIRQHDEAVFGHFSSRARASALSQRAAAQGFKGIKIENEGCGDFEVEIDGADDVPGRVSFAAEARKAGYQVSFEQIGPPLEPPKGQAYGTFAQVRTVASANALALRLAAVGFRYLDIVKIPAGWAVVWPQIPGESASSIAAEVHKAGFSIAFRTS